MTMMKLQLFVMVVLSCIPRRAAYAYVGVQAESNLKPALDGTVTWIEETVGIEDWQEQFTEGLRNSKVVTDSEDWPMNEWAIDEARSGIVIPRQMLLSEDLLYMAMKAPAPMGKDKTAELALRIYYHAKWLAERNFARAAEWRYREAFRLARKCRRSVLAAHSLSRLGYFFMHWRRYSEAREVLKESLSLKSKSNVLAPYLLGVLERQAAGADVKRLFDAEEQILNAQPQPSEDLEEERQALLWEITYWRNAELSARHCFRSADAARLVICLCTHAIAMFQKATP